MNELKSLSQYITKLGNTLVCTQHGPEWWSAWFLRTRISQATALRPDDWQRYDEIYFLEIKSGLQMPQFGPPGAGKPRAVPPMLSSGVNPFMSAKIPLSAPVLHDDVCLKFARSSPRRTHHLDGRKIEERISTRFIPEIRRKEEVDRLGLEPRTRWLKAACSTN